MKKIILVVSLITLSASGFTQTSMGSGIESSPATGSGLGQGSGAGNQNLGTPNSPIGGRPATIQDRGNEFQTIDQQERMEDTNYNSPDFGTPGNSPMGPTGTGTGIEPGTGTGVGSGMGTGVGTDEGGL